MDTCPFNVLSLCSGVGGLDLGLHLAVPAARTVCYIEREAYCCEILVERMEEGGLAEAPVWSNLRTFDGKPWRGVVDCVTAGYPCFVAGTLVLCRDGYRSIESVRVGDFVLTHRGRWRPVTAVMQKTNATLRRVRAHGCSPIVTTNEHPFLLRSGEWRVAEKLQRGDKIGQVLPPIEPDEYSAAIWWLVGRYLADGWRMCAPSQRGKGRVVICCSYSEASELERRIKDAGLHGYASRERTVVKFHICRRWFYELLEPFGRGAAAKRLTGHSLSLDVEKSRALLDGYVSGDGYREDNPKGAGSFWRITTVSEPLALGIALLAQRARGVVASVRQYSGATKCYIEGRLCNQLPQWFVTIPDRNREATVDGDFGWKSVRESSRIESCDTVYNIAVNEDESYIAGGAIVHNCQPFSVAGRRKGDKDERHLWPDVARVVREINPRWCFFENVGNHLRLGFERVHNELSEMGYVVATGLFTAEEIGDTQRRERLFIVADRERPQRRQVAQTGVLFHDRQKEGRQQEECSPGGEGEDVGCAPSDGWGKGRTQHELRSGRGSVAGPGLPVFPPGPEDWDGWRKVLSAEPKVEPAVRGVADGMAARVDRLRACGNGVVPLVAAYAWRTLTSALEGIK